jgi:hypothetical protein
MNFPARFQREVLRAPGHRRTMIDHGKSDANPGRLQWSVLDHPARINSPFEPLYLGVELSIIGSIIGIQKAFFLGLTRQIILSMLHIFSIIPALIPLG